MGQAIGKNISSQNFLSSGSPYSMAVGKLLKNYFAVAGLIFIIFICTVAVFAPVIAPE